MGENDNNFVFEQIFEEDDKQELILDLFDDKYVLIIGSGAILKEDFSGGDVNRYILDTINKDKRESEQYPCFNAIPPLVPGQRHDLHGLLQNQNFYDKKKISGNLIDFLRLCPIKVVLTTTVDSYIDKAMEVVWGEDGFDVLSFPRDFDLFCEKLKKRRFGKSAEERPVLFHIFGKVSNKPNYVRNDNIAIDFIMQWIDKLGGGQAEIVSYIKNRKTLALGCKFDDWYFRFFWHVINGSQLANGSSIINAGHIVFSLDKNIKEEQKLKYYLESKDNVFLHDNINNFLSMLNGCLSDKKYIWDLICRKRGKDIFISYKSVNFDDAKILYAKLIQEGFRVWIDEAGLKGCNDYNQTIPDAIKSAKVFIALLTPEIASDYKYWEKRYYVKEWKAAMQNNRRIIPLAINSFKMTGKDSCYHNIEKRYFGNTHGYDLFNNRNDWCNLIDDLKGCIK